MTQLKIKREAVRKPFNRRRKAPVFWPKCPKSTIKIPVAAPLYFQQAFVPSRISAVSAKKQRELATAIKRARLALMPYVPNRHSR